MREEYAVALRRQHEGQAPPLSMFRSQVNDLVFGTLRDTNRSRDPFCSGLEGGMVRGIPPKYGSVKRFAPIVTAYTTQKHAALRLECSLEANFTHVRLKGSTPARALRRTTHTCCGRVGCAVVSHFQ